MAKSYGPGDSLAQIKVCFFFSRFCLNAESEKLSDRRPNHLERLRHPNGSFQSDWHRSLQWIYNSQDS